MSNANDQNARYVSFCPTYRWIDLRTLDHSGVMKRTSYSPIHNISALDHSIDISSFLWYSIDDVYHGLQRGRQREQRSAKLPGIERDEGAFGEGRESSVLDTRLAILGSYRFPLAQVSFAVEFKYKCAQVGKQSDCADALQLNIIG